MQFKKDSKHTNVTAGTASIIVPAKSYMHKAEGLHKTGKLYIEAYILKYLLLCLVYIYNRSLIC